MATTAKIRLYGDTAVKANAGTASKIRLYSAPVAGEVGSGQTKQNIDVSNHAFNPLNTNNQFTQPTKSTTQMEYKSEDNTRVDLKSAIIPTAKTTAIDFAKGLVKPFVETGVGVVNQARNVGTIVKAINQGKTGNSIVPDASNATYDVPLYGQSGPNITGQGSAVDQLKKSTALGMEVAPYFLAMPEIKFATKVLDTIGTKAIGEVTSQEAKQFAIAYTKKLLVSSATLGTLFGGGQSLETNAGWKQTGINILQSTGTIAAMELVLAPIIGAVLKKNPNANLKDAVDAEIKNEGLQSKPTPEGIPAEFPTSDPTEKTKPVEPVAAVTEFPKSQEEAIPKIETPKAPEMAITPKVENSPLAQEATKYKSAEEFVKALEDQDKLYYHGTKNPEAVIKEGFAFGQPLNKFTNVKNGNLTEISLARSAEKAKTYGEPLAIIETKQGAIDKTLQGYGLDEARIKSNDGIKIMTKSQLTDIWNKANKTAESAPKKEEPLQTPEIKTSKLATGVEQKAVEAGLTKGFEGKPEYSTVNVKDQAKAAVSLIESDPARAGRIAMGHELPPEGLLPESVFTAVENKALKEGDISTLRDLATSSSLTSEATGMGQRIRMLAERNPDSAVGKIQEVIKAREEKATKTTKDIPKAKKTIASDIKKEITKTHKVETWASFVEALKC